MAFHFQKAYGRAIERQLRQYYQSLSEKDRRRYAAVEAIKPGHGGTRYIAHVLGCDPQTVKDGMRELTQLPDDPAGDRIRKPGDDSVHRDAQFRHLAHLIQAFLAAGNPVLSIDTKKPAASSFRMASTTSPSTTAGYIWG